MAEHCFKQNHDVAQVQSKLLHSSMKGQVMNKSKEIKTVAAHPTDQQKFLGRCKNENKCYPWDFSPILNVIVSQLSPGITDKLRGNKCNKWEV